MRPLAAARLSVTGAVYGARSPVVWTDGSPAWRIVLFTGLHVPLGLLLHSVPGAATAHAALTIAVAALLAMGGRIDRVVYAAAYIAGSEVLWRMCGAALFWESGKYAVILIFAIALARLRPVQPRLLPVVYFLLLLPSIALAPYQLLSDEARQQISFELSGPQQFVDRGPAEAEHAACVGDGLKQGLGGTCIHGRALNWRRAGHQARSMHCGFSKSMWTHGASPSSAAL